jgi:hypothetical protein
MLVRWFLASTPFISFHWALGETQHDPATDRAFVICPWSMISDGLRYLQTTGGLCGRGTGGFNDRSPRN